MCTTIARPDDPTLGSVAAKLHPWTALAAGWPGSPSDGTARLIFVYPEPGLAAADLAGRARLAREGSVFRQPISERLFRLDSITCLVDAEGIFVQDDDDQLNMLKLRQIGFADLVVLNKTDLVGPEHLEVVRDWIGFHMKRVSIVEATHGDVPMEILLGVGRFDPTALGGVEPEGLGDGARFDRWSYRSSEPLALDALREMVKRRLPASVYRCKGVLYVADRPEQRFALQVVGRRTQVTELDAWGSGPRRSDIVAIGRDMDRRSLEDLFGACLASA